MLSSISRPKGNQSIKFGQLIEYNKKNILIVRLWRKWGRGDWFQTSFCFFKNALYKVKANGLDQLSFNIFR